ncbi:MAG: putative transposase [Actinomycetota bacterium]|nr:putative transposase [Actinomycetota bacterium]
MFFVPETILRYTYRLRPGAGAARALWQEWGRNRWLWNQACARRKNREPRLTGKDLTGFRAEHEWLRDGSVVAQQQTLRTFWQSKGKRFKSRKMALPSLNYTLRGFSLRDGRLVLAGGLRIPVVWSRDLPSEPTSVRVYRDNLGHWYASFVVRRDDQPPAQTGAMIGIDWGVSTTATTTDPAYDLEASEPGKRAAQRLARYQRMMARRRPAPGTTGSRGYRAAKRRAAKTVKKIQRQRKDTAVKWVTRVVRDHSVIAVEDFKPKFLAKSTMARKAADNGIGMTKTELVERAKRAGREVVLVKPAYTTMTCSHCGTRAKDRLLLSQRIFRCESCGYTDGRDRNAARVILDAVGQYRADVETVRHSDLPSGEERALVESGIPRL